MGRYPRLAIVFLLTSPKIKRLLILAYYDFRKILIIDDYQLISITKNMDWLIVILDIQDSE